VRIDPELLLEDPQRAIALAIKDGRRLIVVEDQGLPGGGSVPGQ